MKSSVRIVTTTYSQAITTIAVDHLVIIKVYDSTPIRFLFNTHVLVLKPPRLSRNVFPFPFRNTNLCLVHWHSATPRRKRSHEEGRYIFFILFGQKNVPISLTCFVVSFFYTHTHIHASMQGKTRKVGTRNLENEKNYVLPIGY